MKTILVLAMALGLAGCVSIDPELVKALAGDNASICINSDIRGGAGAVAGMIPSGGYGQATGNLCRTNQPNAKIEMKPDGSISIQHGNVN